MALLKLHDKLFDVYLGREQLQQLVARLGKEISVDYQGLNPLLIAVLNGSFIFAADLMRSISVECEITFVKVASYESMESSGMVEEILGLEHDINGRHVIIIEDIVDTGLTMSELLKSFEAYYPASIEICSLLVKPESLKRPIEVKYTGITIPPKFVVGYGLDYDGLGRNLPDLYQLAE
jgi:hypoxanthine phosphoribosyltransferase